MNNHTGDTDLNGSLSSRFGETVDDLNRTDGSDISSRARCSELDRAINEICCKYGIASGMAEHLKQLVDYEIVIVCDDSGSMNESVDDNGRTRWNELCDIVKIIREIGVIFDKNGIDIYFLNRKPCLKVKNPESVDGAFAEPPRDYTPLVPVLKKIFQSPLAKEKREKHLLVFVATDGDPTDEDGEPAREEFEQLMKDIRNPETTYVSFLLCTNDPEAVQCFTHWDQKMEHVDVTDDYETEKRKVQQYNGANFRFEYGDYIVKALVGGIIRKIDLLNEATQENN